MTVVVVGVPYDERVLNPDERLVETPPLGKETGAEGHGEGACRVGDVDGSARGQHSIQRGIPGTRRIAAEEAVWPQEPQVTSLGLRLIRQRRQVIGVSKRWWALDAVEELLEVALVVSMPSA